MIINDITVVFIHCINSHASETAKIMKRGITDHLPMCQRDAEEYHLIMIFAVFTMRYMPSLCVCMSDIISKRLNVGLCNNATF